MKKIIAILTVALLSSACSKKEDQPAAAVPHVAGNWQGTGTDDAIGFYNLSANLTQSGNQAAGTFTMAGTVATVSGNISLTVGPVGGNNVQSLALARGTWTVADPNNAGRLCTATMTVSPGSTYMTSSAVTFSYSVTDCQGGTWNGGANLKKTAGIN